MGKWEPLKPRTYVRYPFLVRLKFNCLRFPNPGDTGITEQGRAGGGEGSKVI